MPIKQLTPEHRANISVGRLRSNAARRQAAADLRTAPVTQPIREKRGREKLALLTAALEAKPLRKPPARTKNRMGQELVDSSFIMPAVRRLGTTVAGLAALIGLSPKAIATYVKDRTCPKWFRAAVNGIVAEHALAQDGSGLPAVIPAPAGHRALPAGALVVEVPPGQHAQARALLAALGWHVARGVEHA